MRLRLCLLRLLAAAWITSAASAQTTVTSFSDDFQSYGTQANPAGWVDTSVGSSKPAANGLFKTWPDPLASGNVVYGTKQSSGKPDGNNPRIGTFSTYTTKTFNGSGGFEYRGRFLRTNVDSRIGFTFFSSYPEVDKYYLVGLWAQANGTLTMQLFGFGGPAPTGTLDSAFTPDPNKWYDFVIQCDGANGATNIRARFWLDTNKEPSTWTINATDSAAGRPTDGRIGIWAAVRGAAYVDDLSARSPIDHAPPAIQILVNDKDLVEGTRFNFAPSPKIVVTDDSSPHPSYTATLDGAPFTSGTAVTGQGSHTIAVHAVDDVGNTADLTRHFYVDTLGPSVTVIAPINGSATADNVTINLQINDATPPFRVDATLDGAAWDWKTPITTEAVHKLKLRVTDDVGNVTDVPEITFTIDKTAPAYTLKVGTSPFPAEDGHVFDSDIAINVDIVDLTPNGANLTLDGAVYVAGTTITTEGKHTIAGTVSDKVGHITTVTPRVFYIDKSAPVVSITNDGQQLLTYYENSVKPAISINDVTATTVQATLNGQPFTFGATLTSEGRYELAGSVTDVVNHKTTFGPIVFYIDRTAPVVVLTANGQPLTNAVFPADVKLELSVTDITPVDSVVTLDNITIQLPLTLSADGTHHIEASVTDKLGHKTVVGPFDFTIDKTPPVVTVQESGTTLDSGRFFNRAVKPVILVTDATHVDVHATLDGQPFDSGTSVTVEGTHHLAGSVTDAGQHTVQIGPIDFTIDTTPPTGKFMEGDHDFPDGKSVNRDVSAHVAITDANADPAQTVVLLDGNPYRENDPITTEQSHTLTATIKDKAGNSGTVPSVTVRIDRTPPVLTITGNNAPLASDTKPFGVDVTVNVTAADPSQPVRIDGTLDNHPATLPVTVHADGPHTFSAVGTDAAGNASQPSSVSFLIEQTPANVVVLENNAPAVQNKAFAGDVKVTLQIDQGYTPRTSQVQLDGQPYVLGSAITSEGAHTITGTVTTGSGVVTTIPATYFTIDRTPPVVTIYEGSSILDNDRYFSRKVTPLVKAEDKTAVTLTLKLDGADFVNGSDVAAEGTHVLTGTAVDDAGNSAPVGPLTFHIDLTPPTGKFMEGDHDFPNDAYLARDVSAHVVTGDASPVTTKVKLDGNDYAENAAIVEEGTHTLTATVTDRASNTFDVPPVTVHIDRTPPVVKLFADGNEFPDNHAFSANVVADVKVTDASPYGVTGLLDGQPVTFPVTISSESAHTISATATDAAGNPTTTPTIHFVIDKTPRSVTVLENGAEAKANAIFNSDVTVTLQVSAGTSGYTAAMTLDGAPYTEGTPISTEAKTHTIAGTVTTGSGITSDIPVTQFTIDKTPPAFTLKNRTAAFPANGSYVNSDVVPVVACVDALTDCTPKLTLDGNPWNNNTAVSAETPHTLVVTAVDAATNAAPPLTFTFIIDKTAPSGLFREGTADFPSGRTLNRDVTAHVVVSDVNPDPSKTVVLLNGQPYVENAPISAEGDYTLTATITDLAGNSAPVPPVSFRIDKTAPAVKILAGSKELQANDAFGSDITLNTQVTDASSYTVAGTLDGAPVTFPHAVTTEGPHTIAATATDAAGNAGNAGPIAFIVEKTPPTVTVLENGTAASANKVFGIDVTVTLQIDSGYTERTASITLDGNPYTAGTPVTAEGKHDVAGVVTTRSGLSTNIPPTSFTIDKTAPSVTLKNQNNDFPAPAASYFNTDVVPVVSCTDALTRCTPKLLLDGNPIANNTPVGAEGPHTLVASATDEAGNTTTLDPVTFTIDKTAPILTVTSHTDGQTIATSTVVLSGGADDSITVTANNIPAAVDLNAKTYTTPALPLNEGDNIITLLGVDRAGNPGTKPFHLIVDTRAPELVVRTPLQNACIGEPAVVIAGIVTDPAVQGVKVTLGTNVVDNALDATKQNWSATFNNVAEGPQVATIESSDTFGHVSTAIVRFLVDRTAPEIQVTESGAPFTAKFINHPVFLTIKAKDLDTSSRITATLDSQPYVSGTSIAAAGDHHLDVSAADCAGHQSNVTADFKLDFSAPVFSALSPANGATVSAVPAAITGNANELSRVELEATNIAVTSAANGDFSLAGAHLVEGLNTFVLRATDAAGNVTRVDYSFTVKANGPTVQILENGAPLVDGKLFNRPVTPVVTSEDQTATITALLNTQTYDGKPVTGDGSYTIEGRATDKFNRTATATRTFRIDMTPPVVTITQPQAGSVTATKVTVTGTAPDAVDVTVNGVIAQLGAGGAFTAVDIPLEIGDNTIVAIAHDAAGNSSHAEVVVTVVGKGPGIIITEPAEGLQTNHPRIDVAGRVLSTPKSSQVTIGSKTVPVDSAGFFRLSGYQLVEGANVITVSAATNASQNSATVNVVADFTPPALTVLADGAPFADNAQFPSAVTLTLTATDLHQTRLTTSLSIDGTPHTTPFAVSGSGGHVLTAIARDDVGNETRVDRTFFIGATTNAGAGCVVASTDPASNAVVTSASVKVAGKSPNAASVTVNGRPADVADGTFAVSIDLANEGANELTVQCSDAAGVAGKDFKFTLFRVTGAPSIHITSPSEGAITQAKTLTVSGTVSADVTSADVNGSTATISNGTFTATNISVSNGLNVIVAHARNDALRAGLDSIRVRSVQNAPQVAITSPLADYQTGATSVDVGGTYNDLDPQTLTIAGTGALSITPRIVRLSDTTGTFVFPAVPLAGAATQTLTVSGRNSFNQSASATVKVTNIVGAPWVTITQPADNAWLRGDQPIAVTGTFAAGGNGAHVDINGTTATVDNANSNYNGSTSFNAATALAQIVSRLSTDAGDGAIASVRVNKAGPLTVKEIFPANGSQGVDPSVVILVSFSAPIDPTTLPGAITLRAADNSTATGTLLTDDTIVAFAPTALLGSGVTYTITIASTVKDVAGNTIDAAHTATFTTSVAAPSNPPTIDPVNPSGCVTQLDITGTAPPLAKLRLDTGGITLSGTADSTGHYKFPFPLSGQSGYQVARVRIVGPDGSLSPEASASFRIDCAGPRVLSATYAANVNTLTIVFSKAINPATLSVGPSSSVRITLADGTSTTGTIALAGNNATVTPAADLSSRSFTLTVTEAVTDTAGTPLSPPFAQTFNNGGPAPSDGAGFISGEVYDAMTGRPLAGAQVTVVVPATAFATTGPGTSAAGRFTTITTSATPTTQVRGPAPRVAVNAEVTLTQIADTRGRYTIPLPEGAHTIAVSASGYTNVWRQIVVPAGAGVVPIDIRLTPVGDLKTSTGAAIALSHGGNALTRAASLAIPAGGVASGSKASLTAIGAQSLAGLLPLGWSPLAAVEIGVTDANNQALTDAPIGNAQLTFTLPNADITAANQLLTFVRYDADRDEWRTLVAVMTAGNGGAWTVPVTTAGAYAVVYADRAAGLKQPPAASAGAILQPASDTCVTGTTPCELTKKQFEFDQKTVTPNGRAVATLQITGNTSAPFPSGTAVQAYVSETLTLSGGGTVIDPPFTADLLLYRSLDGTLGEADFSVSPSAQAAQVVLSEGVDHVVIQQYPGRLDRGTLIGSEGGRVPGDASIAVEIPSGATSDTLHAAVAAVPADVVTSTTIDGFDVIAGFDLSMSRSNATAVDLDGDGVPDALPAVQLTRAARATIAIDTTKLANPAAQLILAEAVDDANWKRVYRLAARLMPIDTAANGVTTIRYTTRTIDPAEMPLDGVVREGRYLVLAAKSPIAYATGALASASGGPYVGGGLITSIVAPATPLGVRDVTRNTGIFSVPIATTPSSIVTPAIKGSGSGASANIPAQPADAVVKLGDLVFAMQPPHVASTSPVNNATINLSQPLVVTVTFDQNIDATSVAGSIVVTNTANNIALTGTTSGNGGATVTFTPTAAVTAGAHYSVVVGSAIRGANGAPFGQNYTFGFNTPDLPVGTGGVDPLRFHITIPDDHGVSRVYGDAGAVDGGWRIVVRRADHDFIVRYQTTATAAGFDMQIGGGNPADKITVDDVIDAIVLNPAGNVARIVRLTPFVTTDGRGFIAPFGLSTTFRSADGIIITVPAGTFDEPTLIHTSVLASTDAFITAPNVANEINIRGGIQLDFNGEAHQRIDVSIPMPANLPANGNYLLGWLGQSTQGPRIAIVDTLRTDGNALTTSFPPQSGAAMKAITNAGLTDMQVKSCLIGVTRQGQYALCDLTVPTGGSALGWAIVSDITRAVEAMNSLYHSMYLPDFAFSTLKHCAAFPILKGKPFTVTGYDSATGLTAFTKDYSAISLTDPDVSPITNPDPDLAGPYVTFGTPYRIEDVTSSSDTTTGRGYKVVVSPSGITIQGDPDAPASDQLPKDVSVMAFNATRGELSNLYHTADSGAFSFAINGQKGDHVLLFIGAADVDPDSSVNVVFNEPVYVGDIPANSSPAQRAQIVNAYLRTVLKVEQTVSGVKTVVTDQVTFDADSLNRRVLLTFPSLLVRGATYTLTIGTGLHDPQGNAVCLLKDSNGNALGTAGGKPIVLELMVRPPTDSTLVDFRLNPASTYSNASLRDMARLGNIAFVTAQDGGLLAYDLSNPAALKPSSSGTSPYPMAVVPARWRNPDGSLIPGGFGMNEFWGVAVDHHGRVWATGLSNIFAEVHEYKLEDFLHARDKDDPSLCSGFPGAPANANCRQYAGAILAWRPGYSAAQPLSSNAALTDQPEAFPRRMQVLTQDDPSEYAALDDLETAQTVQAKTCIAQNNDCSTNAVYQFNVKFDYVAEVPAGGGTAGSQQNLVQRITVINRDLELSWSGDLFLGEGGTITGIVARPNDHLTVLRNHSTLGVVTLFSFGVGIYDLNAMESNDFGLRCNGQFAGDHGTTCGLASGHRRFPETFLQSKVDQQSNCSPIEVTDPGIQNLSFTPETSSLVPADTATSTVLLEHVHTFGLDPHQGVLPFNYRLPTDGDTNLQSCVTRPPTGLLLKSNPRLSAINGKATAPRFNSVVPYHWHLDAADNTTGQRGSVPKTSVDRDYILVSGGTWGLIIIEVGGTQPPNGPPYGILADENLADVIWTPAGCYGVRTTAGSNLATVVDGKGRLLLVDLSNIDERWDPPSDPTQAATMNSGPFKIPTDAMNGAAASSDELGANDPRIVYQSPFSVTTGTLVPLIDPETGMSFGGNVNSPDMHVAPVLDPKMEFVVDTGNGLAPTKAIIPLGIDSSGYPQGTAGTFRVRLTLPGAITETVSGQLLRVAVESERIPGALAPQVPAGFPRAHLRGTDRDGTTDSRPTSFAMQHAIPQPPGMSADQFAKTFRHQQGYNQFLSPWVIAMTDPRASKEFVWPSGADKAALGCSSCDRSAATNSLAEPQAYEMLSNGRAISARFEHNEFFGTPYAYLDTDQRAQSRVASIPADLVRPSDGATEVDKVAAKDLPTQGVEQEHVVNLNTGEVVKDATDLTIKGRGIDFMLLRVYSSAIAHIGPFGRNFDSPLFARIRRLPNGDVEFYDGSGRRDLFAGGVTPPDGVFLSMVRNANGYVVQYPDNTRLYFDTFGRLSKMADRNNTQVDGSDGNFMTFAYGPHGDLSTVIDPTGRTVTFEYYKTSGSGAYPGCISKVKDFDNREVDYLYDSSGRLTNVSGPDPESSSSAKPSTTYAWGPAAATSAKDQLYASGGMTSEQDGLSRTIWTVGYDGTKKWAANTLASGGGTWSFSVESDKTTVTDPNGHNWEYGRNADRQVSHLIEPGNVTTTYAYDSAKRLETVTQPLGDKTTYGYQGASGNDKRPMGNVTTVTEGPRTGSDEAVAGMTRTTVVGYGPANQPTSVQLPDGSSTSMLRDARGNLRFVTDPSGVTITYQYDGLGQLQVVSDPRSGSTSFSYALSGLKKGYMTSITNSSGSTTFGTDNRGNVRQITKTSGENSSFSINKLDQLEQENVGQSSSSASYDAAGSLTKLSRLASDPGPTPIFSTTNFGFDEIGRIKSRIENGLTTIYGYEPSGPLATINRAGNAPVTYAYDARERLISVTDGSRATQYGYDDDDTPTSFTNPRGKTTTRKPSGFGHTNTTSNSFGITDVFTRDALGRVVDTRTVKTTSTGEKLLLRWRTNDYDRTGRVTKTVRKLFTGQLPIPSSGDPVGATDVVTQYIHDDANRKMTTIDPRGNRTVTEFDGLGQIARITDPLGNVTEMTFDANGNKRTERSIEHKPDGSSDTTTMHYDYDEEDHVTAVTNQNTGEVLWQYRYDQRGNVIEQVNAEGGISTFEYDVRGNRIRETDAEGHVTERHYDEVNHMDSLKDANGNITLFKYDEFGNVIEEQRSDLAKWTYAYDSNNNLERMVDPNGTTVDYRYDDEDRLLSKTITKGANVQGPSSITLANDDLGRVVATQTNEGVRTTSTFDSLDRQLTEEIQIGNGPLRRVVKSYDDGDNLTAIHYPSGLNVTRAVDALNRTAAIAEAGVSTPLVTYGYVGPRMTVRALVNGVTTAWSYDARSRLVGIADSLASIAGRATTYDWTPAGRKSRATRNDLHKAWSYQHDRNGWMTEESIFRTDTEKNSLLASASYDIDPVLNYRKISSVDQTGNTATTRTVTPSINSRNQYTTFGSQSLSYDHNGNLTQKDDLRLAYDYENRLARAILTDGTTIDTTYAADGTKAIQTVTTSGQSHATEYVIAAGGVLEEYTDGALSARYVHGERVDETVRAEVGGMLMYPLQDETGNVDRLTDSAGATIERYEYSGYGQFHIFGADGTARPRSQYNWRWLFEGREYDSALGAYDFRARTLWPDLGRFGQEDPSRARRSLTPYEALLGSPTLYTDPSGLYESDVHYGMTLYLTLEAGYDRIDALSVAFEDADIDVRASTAPNTNASAGNWGPVYQWHFPVDPTQHKVVEDGPEAYRILNTANDLIWLGRGLHLLQDSFSHHNAYPGNITGQAKKFGKKWGVELAKWIGAVKNPEPGITHEVTEARLQRYDPLKTHNPAALKAADWTFTDPELAKRMEYATFQAVLNFKKKTGVYSQQQVDAYTTKWFNTLEPIVRVFNRARTEPEKRQWFAHYLPWASEMVDWSDVSLHYGEGF